MPILLTGVPTLIQTSVGVNNDTLTLPALTLLLWGLLRWVERHQRFLALRLIALALGRFDSTREPLLFVYVFFHGLQPSFGHLMPGCSLTSYFDSVLALAFAKAGEADTANRPKTQAPAAAAAVTRRQRRGADPVFPII
ncbi:hypothetical protein [Bifidobacterium samirii]|uniref:hypothetical protein n=1 Tax=Bifidobacterium samirii TaxID=2306974 RepID=UPI000F7EBAB3|nr:hypothetical protein [Bifidobacterium samirii]